MDIAFIDKKLRKFAQSSRAAQLKFGTRVASALRSCMADISAAESVSEIPLLISMLPENPKAFAIVLDGGAVVIFECSHIRALPRVRGTDQIDLDKVRRVMLMNIRVADDNS